MEWRTTHLPDKKSTKNQSLFGNILDPLDSHCDYGSDLYRLHQFHSQNVGEMSMAVCRDAVPEGFQGYEIPNHLSTKANIAQTY